MHKTLNRALSRLSRLCAALVLAMLLLFLLTGIGQEPLQSVHAAAAYQTLLLRNPPVLRAVLGLDNLFLIAYSAVFVLWSLALARQGAPRQLLAVALLCLLGTGLLDLLENLHFLVMLDAVEQGLTLTDGEIAAQAWESMAKFHLSYLGLLLQGLAMPGARRAERVLKILLCAVQFPMGVAIYVLPPPWSHLLVFGRLAFFLCAFLLLDRCYREPEAAAGSGVLAG